jgi:hypothetical protein
VEIRSQIKIVPPSQFPHLQIRAKKYQIEDGKIVLCQISLERQQEIARTNKVLLDKMLQLMRENGHAYTDRNLNTFHSGTKKSHRSGRASVVIDYPYSPVPLHYEHRKRELVR